MTKTPYDLRWEARDRRTILGGSEAAAVLGLDPYASEFDVYARKVLDEPEFEGNEATRWGNILEPLIVKEMARADGIDLTDPERVLIVDSAHDSPFIVHPTEPWLGVHVDGFTRPGDEWYADEAKSTRLYNAYGDEGSIDMPDSHYIQCQLESLCTGMPVRYGAFLLGDRRVWRTVIRPDPSVQQQLLNKLGEWWEKHVVKGEAPPLRGKTAETYLQRTYQEHSGHVLDATAEMTAAIERWRWLDGKSRDLKAELAEAKNAVCALIGDDLGIKSHLGTAKWGSVKGRESISLSALKKHPDLLAMCKERGLINTGKPSRSLRFTKARSKK